MCDLGGRRGDFTALRLRADRVRHHPRAWGDPLLRGRGFLRPTSAPGGERERLPVWAPVCGEDPLERSLRRGSGARGWTGGKSQGWGGRRGLLTAVLPPGREGGGKTHAFSGQRVCIWTRGWRGPMNTGGTRLLSAAAGGPVSVPALPAAALTPRAAGRNPEVSFHSYFPAPLSRGAECKLNPRPPHWRERRAGCPLGLASRGVTRLRESHSIYMLK